MSWTDDRVALLTKLWKEGKTAKEIAETLGDGVTRNAVIGKAHRLNLSGRASPIQQSGPASSSSRAKPGTTPSASSSPTRKTRAPAPKKKELPQPANKNIEQPKPKREGGVALSDLKDSMCRWPEGDPKEDGFHFCGGASVPGFPYCEEHIRAAYQTNKKTKILTPEALEGPARDDDEDEEEQIA